MLCDKCKINPATFHSSVNINGNVITKNLCQDCASIEDETDFDMLINDNRGIPVIAYHSISDENVESPLVVSTERFREHMQLLKDKGYTTLTIRQVENYILNGGGLDDDMINILSCIRVNEVTE